MHVSTPWKMFLFDSNPVCPRIPTSHGATGPDFNVHQNHAENRARIELRSALTAGTGGADSASRMRNHDMEVDRGPGHGLIGSFTVFCFAFVSFVLFCSG
ncbi:hypothetical protein BDZ91DRAFT_711875 [Kalaharituber pfeilii]|nr:hypothetical protein BDZ91DRAFT_711875 [Kalaharituber pfeilii]